MNSDHIKDGLDALSQIKSNTCPYCNGVYSIATNGCENKCPDSQKVAQMIREYLDEECDYVL